ncbi:MAG: AI-2E family transporter [Chitinivibrionales bacterium]|nr:AI-2E family transporter [Chitinivibrionales bacterium]
MPQSPTPENNNKPVPVNDQVGSAGTNGESNSQPREDKTQTASESGKDGNAGSGQQLPEREPEEHSAEASASETAQTKSGSRLNRRVLIIMLVILGVLLIPIVKLFLVPLVLASTFTTLFYPMYAWLLMRLKGKKALCSLLSCLVLILGVLIPTYVLVHLVTLQTIELYGSAEPRIREIVSRGEEGILGEIQDSKVVRWLRLSRIDWRSSLQDAARTVGKFLTEALNRTSTGVLQLVANLAIMLFTMFYFFIDGERFVKRLRYLSPLRNDYEDLIVNRFLLISRATVKGTFLVGLVQGSIGGIALLVFGVKTWLLWAFIMVILSIIPMVGAWLVMVPAAVIQLLLGNIWQGIGIAAASTVVISNIDNLIRPRLVGKDAKMHDLLIFFSTLGGIAIFGIMGFIVGPVIAALFVTVLDIYGMEFKEELLSPYTS